MATRLYDSLKYRYTNDFNDDLIKVQRAYKHPDNTYVTAITSLFFSRIFSSPYKIIPTKFDPRHILTYVTNPENLSGYSEFKVGIPFNPIELNHKQHILEILAYTNVECGDYVGESNVVINL